jgi:hypothetical protein
LVVDILYSHVHKSGHISVICSATSSAKIM